MDREFEYLLYTDWADNKQTSIIYKIYVIAHLVYVKMEESSISD